MPKITASSVPEHRRQQRAALLQAGQDVLLSDGLAALNPTSVSGRAGIARSSFYDYFPTKDDLLVAIASAMATPFNGTVRVHGTDAGKLSRSARTRFRLHHIAFVFQSGNLIPSLTAADQLRLAGRLAHASEVAVVMVTHDRDVL